MNSDTVAGVADPGPRTRRLQTAVLRSVSRSSYLSIRFLRAQLREPIALAYLFARTTDTVADTTEISTAVKMETLQMLSNRIQGKAPRDVVSTRIASILQLPINTNQ